MRTSAPAARPITWALAALFLVFIDLGITRSRLLWGPTAFENTRNMTQIVFAQTYQAARKLYTTGRGPERRIAVLGNSRILLGAREPLLQPELDHLAPGLRAVNLGIFGAGIGDQEAVLRHLPRLAPSLVILTLGASDLQGTPASPLSGQPAEMLRIGWAGVDPEGAAERVDRWVRTLWALYGFREFARAALVDRVAPPPDPGPPPDHFPSTRALFDHIHGGSGAAVEAAYRAWRREPTLEAFIAYLEIGSPSYLDLVRQRASGPSVDEDSRGVRLLDAVLARLAAGPWRSLVVIMPENPLIELDTGNRYHRPGLSDDAAAIVRGLAARRDIPVVDARRWMPAEAFIDFDHLMTDLSGFQRPLAAEIVRASGV